MSNEKIDITQLPIEVVEKLVSDPVYFALVAFNQWLWSKQREIAWALVKYQYVAVYSATGTGKSHTVSCIVPHFLQTKENIIIPIVSPNFRGAIRTIWKPIVNMYQRSRIKLKGEPTSTKWQVNQGVHYAEVLSARKIEALQGLHSLYQLQILEEASGLEDMVWDAMDGNATSSSGMYRLVIGNPLRPEGEFYKTLFNPRYYKIKISVFDTPLFTGEIDEIPEKYAKVLRRVLPDENFVKNAEFKYGKDSPFYKAKVLGIFPEESESGLFNVEDIEYCMNMDLKVKDYDEVYLTLDPARQGDDYSVFIVWKGFKPLEMVEIKKNDTPAVIGITKQLVNKYNVDKIILDSTGYGAGIYDMLVEDNVCPEIYGVNFSQNAFEEDKYANMPTEMMFSLQKALKERAVQLPKSDLLKQELLAIEYTFDSKGRFKLIDSKVLKKKKLKRSPDHAFAVALRFANVLNTIGIA